MYRNFTSVFKTKIFKGLVIFLVIIQVGMMGHWGWAKNNQQELSPNSLAWQMEELTKWLMTTRNLVPHTTIEAPPFFVIDSLELSGSVEKNRFTFTLKGSVLSEKSVLVPLFGPPDQVMLTNVTINEQPAVVGFESKDYYYVKTKKRDFTIKGNLSLLNESGFKVPGPLNLFTSDLTDGRVVEGMKLPGLKDAVLHLETGKPNKTTETLHSPLFQVSRAIRIQKEITFEYQVKVRSGSEISKVEMPMKYSEIVLDVPDIKGWKIEKDTLVVPASGRNVVFTVTGRLPKIGVFETDTRSNHEWWFIESDAEHRVKVNTNGKPVDSSRSPLKKQLSSSRLFLLAKGQQISVNVQSLTTLDALAVVINSQFRKIIWTKNGELVAEDHISYQNNGVDYIPFNCNGKPIYLEVDNVPKTILSENPGQKGHLLIPLKEGEHSFCVQSTMKVKPALLGGLLPIPTAAHNLMVSRSSVRIGLPAGIIPVWFFGGEQVGGPIDWKHLSIIGVTLLLVLLFFRDIKARIAGFIAFFGLYLLSPKMYIILCFIVALVFIFKYIKRRLKSWRKLVAFGLFNLAVIGLILYASDFYDMVNFYRHSQGMTTAGSSGGIAAIASPLTDFFSQEDIFEMDHGGDLSHFYKSRYTIRKSTGSDYSDEMDENVLRGVIPVPLPLPGFKYSRTITKESVTRNQPLTPTLLYVTWITVLPLILFWLFCWGYLGFRYRRHLTQDIAHIKTFWQNSQAEKK